MCVGHAVHDNPFASMLSLPERLFPCRRTKQEQNSVCYSTSDPANRTGGPTAIMAENIDDERKKPVSSCNHSVSAFRGEENSPQALLFGNTKQKEKSMATFFIASSFRFHFSLFDVQLGRFKLIWGKSLAFALQRVWKCRLCPPTKKRLSVSTLMIQRRLQTFNYLRIPVAFLPDSPDNQVENF